MLKYLNRDNVILIMITNLSTLFKNYKAHAEEFKEYE